MNVEEKTKFLLALRTLENDKAELTYSDLTGCVIVLAKTYFKENSDATDIILEYLNEEFNEELMFKHLGVLE